MRNQRGSVVFVTVVMILLLMTLSGILGMKRSMRETRDSRQHVVSNMNFYAAEGGLTIASIQAKELELAGYFTEPVTPITGDIGSSHYSVDIDIIGTGSFPDFIAEATGIHHYGRTRLLQAMYRYSEVIPNPEAAMWVSSIVSANGNVAIHGEDASGTCADVPGIKHVLPTSEENLSIDKFHAGNLSGNPAYTDVTYGDGIFVYDIDSIVSSPAATIIDDENVDLCDEIGTTDEDHPVIVVLTADTAKISGNCTGYGVLVATNNLEIAGTVSWHGLVLVQGNAELKGGGGLENLTVDGAIVVTGETMALQGNVTVQYNCETLTTINHAFSHYSRVWWREIMPKFTVMPNGTIIRR